MWSFLWIAVFIINGIFHPIGAEILRCFKGSLDKYEDTHIACAEAHITSGCINPELTTAIFVHGYNGNADTDTTQAMIKGLMSYPTKLNVILLDWSDKSTTPNNTDSAEYYRDKAVPASISVGKQLGRVLVKLTKLKFNLLNTVLIGFSLGCHLVGHTGREVKALGKEVWLIYGVEPANPLFNNHGPQYKSLNRACAKYVFCSHFDPGYLGARTSNCLSDVWVNYGNFLHGIPLQPGCPKRDLLSTAFLLTDAVKLRCYRGSLDDNEETTLDKPESFIKSGCIDTNRPTAFFALGFKSNNNTDTTKAVLLGLMAYPTELNVVLVDWASEAYGPNITIVDDAVFYSLRAVPAAIAIGKRFGDTLLRLSDNKMSLNDTILMGFSLGCHLMGYAGRHVKAHGKELQLIHGMEPANPLFGKPLPILTPLNKNDAKYVVCSHTDPGYFGTNQSNCLADIWLNYGYYTDGVDLQPGCPSRMSMRGCSHIRVTFVMKEALTHPGTLVASAATNYAAWEARNGSATNIVDLGNFLNTTYAVGNYYMSTNGDDPYGEGEDGLRPHY